jgi:iron complex outermembrane receptor protein
MKTPKMHFSKKYLSFKQWTNKKYSVFNSLKLVVRISALSATYSLVLMPTATFSQSDTVSISKNVDIEEVEIGGQKRATTYSEITRAVLVITKDDLGAVPASTLSDLLKHIAGVDVRQRGGHGVQADIMLRGGTFDQVLVLLNGVNVTDPQTGHHNLNIPIDFDAIDRIEILHGPGARIYGQGAFSGTINIITIPSKINETDASIELGEYGLLKTSTTVNLSKKNFDSKFAFSTAKSNGFSTNTDFSSVNIFSHNQVSLKKAQINIQGGVQDKGFGAQSFYTPRYPNQYEKTSTLFASESISLGYGKTTINQTAYYRKHFDRFELFRRNSPAWYTNHNFHTTNVLGFSIAASQFYGFGKLRLGSEFRREAILSTNLGEPLSTPVKIAGVDSTMYTKGTSRNWANLFAENTFYLGKFSLSAGGMVSFRRATEYNFAWGADFGYDMPFGIKSFASVNSTFRYPTFTDLYYTGPTNQGNPNLNPERATTYELGIKQQSSQAVVSLLGFYRVGNDIIDWVKFAPDQVKWTTANHKNINSLGFEGSLYYSFGQNNPYITSISLNYSFTETVRQSGEAISYYALDFLRHKVTATANHKIFKHFTLNWSIVLQNRAGNFTEYPSNIEKPYAPFAIANIKLIGNLRNTEVWLNAHNVTNVEYFDLGNVTQPGRWLSIGVNISIN